MMADYKYEDIGPWGKAQRGIFLWEPNPDLRRTTQGSKKISVSFERLERRARLNSKPVPLGWWGEINHRLMQLVSRPLKWVSPYLFEWPIFFSITCPLFKKKSRRWILIFLEKAIEYVFVVIDKVNKNLLINCVHYV